MHIKKIKIQLFLLLKYSNLTVGKRSLFKTATKQLRQGRDEQCPMERTEELSGDSLYLNLDGLQKSSILSLVGHAHAAKARLLCDVSCCCRRSPMPLSLPGTVTVLPCCLQGLWALPALPLQHPHTLHAAAKPKAGLSVR